MAKKFRVEADIPLDLLAALQGKPLPNGDRWQTFFKSNGQFAKGMSTNHRAVLAALAVALGEKRGSRYWELRLRRELNGSDPLCGGEFGSNTYMHIHVGAVWSLRKDPMLRPLADRWLATIATIYDKGAVSTPDNGTHRSASGRLRYNGPSLPSVGLRSTPKHFDAIPLCQLYAELRKIPYHSRVLPEWSVEIARLFPFGNAVEPVEVGARVPFGIFYRRYKDGVVVWSESKPLGKMPLTMYSVYRDGKWSHGYPWAEMHTWGRSAYKPAETTLSGDRISTESEEGIEMSALLPDGPVLEEWSLHKGLSKEGL